MTKLTINRTIKDIAKSLLLQLNHKVTDKESEILERCLRDEGYIHKAEAHSETTKGLDVKFPEERETAPFDNDNPVAKGFNQALTLCKQAVADAERKH